MANLILLRLAEMFLPILSTGEYQSTYVSLKLNLKQTTKQSTASMKDTMTALS